MLRRLCVLIAPLVGGCASPPCPPMDHVRRVETDRGVDLAAYLPEQAGWQWHFGPAGPQATPGIAAEGWTFAVRVDHAEEGVMLTRRPYQTAQGLGFAHHPERAWGWGLLAGGTGFFIGFEPPLVMVPRRLEAGEPLEVAGQCTVWNRQGRRLLNGSYARRIALEGLEEVRSPAGAFADCARLRTSTSLRFALGPSAELTQYLWLAPGVGPVRMIDHAGGWLLGLIPFEFRRDGVLVSRTAPDGPTRRPEALWRGCSVAAMLFERLGPSPTLLGVWYQFAPSSATRPVAAGSD